jgi:hypothetical protein
LLYSSKYPSDIIIVLPYLALQVKVAVRYYNSCTLSGFTGKSTSQIL